MEEFRPDSDEAIQFMRRFSYLSDLCDRQPEELKKLHADEDVVFNATELFRVAGKLQNSQTSAPNLAVFPVNPKFIDMWNEFERSFAEHVLELLRNSKNPSLAVQKDFYKVYESRTKKWAAADAAAIYFSLTIDTAVRQAEDRISSGDYSFEFFTFQSQLNKDLDASGHTLNELMIKAFEKTEEMYRQTEEDCLSKHNDAADQKESLRKLSKDKTSFFIKDEELDSYLYDCFLEWCKAKIQAGLDLRGIMRRRHLVPFVHFPRHTALTFAKLDSASVRNPPSAYDNLRQAHDAFIFGAPSAALALMRAVVEKMLRTSYGATGSTLEDLINSVSRKLPAAANQLALHRLRKRANAILHDSDRAERSSAEPLPELREFELEMVSLLDVVRSLIEGAPKSV